MISSISGTNFSNLDISRYSQLQSLGLLSSGTQSILNSPASVSIADRFSNLSSASLAAQQGLENTLSATQTADAWMGQIGESLIRMNELAIQANSGILNDQDLANINEEFQALGAEINNVVTEQATFNERPLLDGSFNVTTPAGPTPGQTLQISLPDLTDLNNTIQSLDLTSQANAQTAVETLQDGINTLSEGRALTGAVQSQLSAANLTFSAGLYQDNASRIGGIDFALEISNLLQSQIQTDVNLALQAQDTPEESSLLQLLNPV